MTYYLDRTYCGSPNCQNECGRKLTEQHKCDLTDLLDAGYTYAHVSYAYFCGVPEPAPEIDGKKEIWF